MERKHQFSRFSRSFIRATSGCSDCFAAAKLRKAICCITQLVFLLVALLAAWLGFGALAGLAATLKQRKKLGRSYKEAVHHSG